jgi:predicted NBD/HSP70 family sugar kinase
VNDLLLDGYIREEKTARSGERGGRIPIGLKIVERLILGIEWQDSYLRYSLSNLTGQSLKRGMMDLMGNTISQFTDTAKKLIQDLENEFSDRVSGVALGLPGRINPDLGRVISSKPLALFETNLTEILVENLGLPVLIENDANCFAWGEIMGRREFDGNLVCLLLQFHSPESQQTWDQEIGIGIVHHGSVYHGSGFAAGELMNSPVSDELRDLFLRELKEQGPSDMVAIETYILTLFKTLNPIISALDPQRVILGGEFFQHSLKLEAALKSSIPFKWSFSDKGLWEVAQGAASFFIRTIFTLPGFNESALLKGQWEKVIKVKQNQGGTHVER